jgi:hypothetical protein
VASGFRNALEIVIGGGVAMSYYSVHRNTFDQDAW